MANSMKLLSGRPGKLRIMKVHDKWYVVWPMGAWSRTTSYAAALYTAREEIAFQRKIKDWLSSMR
jgi:hypothetical protein